MSAVAEDRLRPIVGRLRVGQWFALAAAALTVLTGAGIVVGVLAVTRLAHAREIVVDRLDPASMTALQLTNALLSEETAVRSFAMTGRADFLTPFDTARRDERLAVARLRREIAAGGVGRVGADFEAVTARAQDWRRAYVEPEIARVWARGPRSATVAARSGEREFEAVGASLRRMQADLVDVRAAARRRHVSAARFLSLSFLAVAVLVLVGLALVVVALRRTVSLPLSRVGFQVRRTARGDYGHEIAGDGPRDIVDLGRDVESMRRRILHELSSAQEAHARLDRQTRDLQRSNAELEQFAYVASHDLQEPLRKVASFCQLLEKRYDGQLDERAHQYIAFAVDGSKRMQQLINDLLELSRVGREKTELTVVDCDDLVGEAIANLGVVIDETGARIELSPLPRVRGEATLLVGVFQNLIGNALKFRHDGAAPRVAISAQRDGESWVFACADDGIGIEPDYAERIFMIFQRLHAKDVYPGTGIGLAMCRKIVEHHGGSIWLDTEAAAGTTFRFTLPVLQENT